MTTCEYKFLIGKKKGSLCGRLIKDSDNVFCWQHKKYTSSVDDSKYNKNSSEESDRDSTKNINKQTHGKSNNGLSVSKNIQKVSIPKNVIYLECSSESCDGSSDSEGVKSTYYLVPEDDSTTESTYSTSEEYSD